VDKVDENSLTGKASNSFQFVQPIVSDLQLLELKGFGFKFFLWDKLVDDYRSVARPDRVKYYELRWAAAQLKEMLSRRLRAHSSNTVSSLDQIVDDGSPYSVDEIVALFSQGSPRTVIRICKEILDQQSEIDSTARTLSLMAVIKGFDVFAANYTNESLDENVVRELQKVKRADFTVKTVYNDIFKITQQSALNKVKSWQDTGSVEQIGVIQETKGARSSNHYGISNLLLLKHLFPELNIFDLIAKKVRLCRCGQPVIRDWDKSGDHACQNCQVAAGELQLVATR
jgi:hypothetical protein